LSFSDLQESPVARDYVVELIGFEPATPSRAAHVSVAMPISSLLSRPLTNDCARRDPAASMDVTSPAVWKQLIAARRLSRFREDWLLAGGQLFLTGL
jgi:hypothetical protein